MKTLYIFIDESGNFDFSPTGTRQFVLTALTTLAPFDVSSPLLQLRYELLPNYACGPSYAEDGHFHAAEDKQAVRDQVFQRLLKVVESIRVDSVIAQKNKTHPSLQRDHVKFYSVLGEAILKYALNRAKWQGYEHVVLVFSSLFDRKKRGVLKQSFKSLVKSHANVPYSLYFHDARFELGNQAVDYFGWAIYRKWESGDQRSYSIVRYIIKSEFAIFARGSHLYYRYKSDPPDYPAYAGRAQGLLSSGGDVYPQSTSRQDERP